MSWSEGAEPAESRPRPALLAYRGEDVERQLAGTRHLVLIGARAPVAFFAYPGQPRGRPPSGAPRGRPHASAMYTISALWTQAREQLDVTTVVPANRSYRILTAELGRVGAEGGGVRARGALELAPPELDVHPWPPRCGGPGAHRGGPGGRAAAGLRRAGAAPRGGRAAVRQRESS